ncbi:hypothetical protein RDABS01_031664 [Bienertia sinuspersici]
MGVRTLEKHPYETVLKGKVEEKKLNFNLANKPPPLNKHMIIEYVKDESATLKRVNLAKITALGWGIILQSYIKDSNPCMERKMKGIHSFALYYNPDELDRIQKHILLPQRHAYLSSLAILNDQALLM